MKVLPADHRADLQKLEKIDGEPASLETEEEFESLFPNCAKGAMRPFGFELIGALIKLKIAVLAPIPKPRIRTAVMANPGDLKSNRIV
jgi:prolyl-tRNA editing enzyme YbaK/EbsC (Cys-tRNA(Pro) deacylase)